MTGEAELLDRAAAKLDRLLAGTTTGRWQVDGPWWHTHVVSGAEGDEPTQMVSAGPDRQAVLLGVPDQGTGRDSGPDLAYAAAVGPKVGRALVRLLQAEAVSARDATETVSPWAVSVAREILGEEKEGAEGWTGPPS